LDFLAFSKKRKVPDELPEINIEKDDPFVKDNVASEKKEEVTKDSQPLGIKENNNELISQISEERINNDSKIRFKNTEQ